MHSNHSKPGAPLTPSPLHSSSPPSPLVIHSLFNCTLLYKWQCTPVTTYFGSIGGWWVVFSFQTRITVVLGTLYMSWTNDHYLLLNNYINLIKKKSCSRILQWFYVLYTYWSLSNVCNYDMNIWKINKEKIKYIYWS